MVIDSYDYKLSCPKQMIKFVQENMKDKTVHINWDKFDIGDIFYSHDDDIVVAYKCVMVDHSSKIIAFVSEKEYYDAFK